MSTRADIVNSSTAMLASPNSASMALGIGGAAPVRPKHLFYLNFVKGNNNQAANLGFIVKSMDQPSVVPQTEEMDQYGKKRIIYTGVKYQPVTATLYDTVDAAALSLWAEYGAYYFGDFSEAETSWQDDIVSSTMQGLNDFGFRPQTADSVTQGLNSQFYFERIELYEVFGGTFIQTNIIHPKITSFERDTVDYEDASPAMVRMAFSYEGLVYVNEGLPQSLSGSAILSEAFSGLFSGHMFDPPGVSGSSIASQFVSSFGSGSNGLLNTLTNAIGSALGISSSTTNTIERVATKVLSSGVLSKFGNYSFGSSTPATTSSSDLSYLSDDGTSLTADQIGLTNDASDGTMMIGTNTDDFEIV